MWLQESTGVPGQELSLTEISQILFALEALSQLPVLFVSVLTNRFSNGNRMLRYYTIILKHCQLLLDHFLQETFHPLGLLRYYEIELVGRVWFSWYEKYPQFRFELPLYSIIFYWDWRISNFKHTLSAPRFYWHIQLNIVRFLCLVFSNKFSFKRSK